MSRSLVRSALRYLFIALTLMPLVFAQNNVSLRYYDLEKLGSIPGVVELSKDFQAIIEFEGLTIDHVTSARIDQLLIETFGSTVHIRADKDAVNTDLIIVASGKTALFTLIFDPSMSSPRRYLVRRSTGATVPVRNPIYQAPGDDRVTINNSAAAASGIADNLPPGLSFNATASRASNGDIVIQYSMSNEGENKIVNDPLQLRILLGENRIPYTLSRLPSVGSLNKIPTGGSEYGTLIVKNPPDGKLELAWTIIETGPGNYFTIRRDILDMLNERAPIQSAPATSPTSNAPEPPSEPLASEPASEIEATTNTSSDITAGVESTPATIETSTANEESDITTDVSENSNITSTANIFRPAIETPFETMALAGSNGRGRLTVFSGNLLTNTIFNDASTEPWTHVFSEKTNAAGSGSIREGEHCLTIERPGENPWNVGLVQANLMLKPGKDYVFSFDAYADKSTGLLPIIGKSEAPYTRYFSIVDPVQLTQAKQSYRYVFTANGVDSPNNRLYFQLGGKLTTKDLPVSVCFDNLILTESNLGPKQVNQEDSAANLLGVSTFEDSSNEAWETVFSEAANAAGTADIYDGAYCLRVESPGENIWNVGLMQNNLPLKQGQDYLLSFDAYADKSFSLITTVGKSEAPFTTYYMNAMEAKLTPDKQTYRYTFSMNHPDDAGGRLYFNLGSYLASKELPATVCLDNVLLTELSEESIIGQSPVRSR